MKTVCYYLEERWENNCIALEMRFPINNKFLDFEWRALYSIGYIKFIIVHQQKQHLLLWEAVVTIVMIVNNFAIGVMAHRNLKRPRMFYSK